MSRQTRRLPLILIVTVVGLCVGLIIGPLALDVAAANGSIDLTPDQIVHAAWRNMQKSGEYRFATQLEQITWPAPKLTNVGRSSKRETLDITGQANLPASTLLLALNDRATGGNPLTQAASDTIEIQITGNSAQGRVSGGDWAPIENFSGSFAPGNDPVAYLVGATNIQVAAADPMWPASVKRYTFEMDTVAFSKYVGDQLEQQLRSSGELPPSVQLDTASLYRSAQGSGEVLISADGLPTRLQVHLAFPQDASGQRVEFNVSTSFSDFNRANLLTTATPPTLGAALVDAWRNFSIEHNLPRTAGDLGRAGLLLVIVAGLTGLVLLALLHPGSKRVRTVMAVVLIFSLIVPPTLESGQVYAYNEAQRVQAEAAQQDQADRDAVQTAVDQVLSPAWNPQQDPLQAAQADYQALLADLQSPSLTPNIQLPTSNVQSPTSSLQSSTTASSGTDLNCTEDKTDADGDGLNGLQECLMGTTASVTDTDGDGLTDKEELLLGTNPLDADTDGDLLTDKTEVLGTSADGKTWYSDPNNPDTNGDGVNDGFECPQRTAAVNNDGTLSPLGPKTDTACQDSNGNGKPDLFDEDNDGDKVVDAVDISPNDKATGYSRGTPFKFTLNGLAKQSGNRSYPLMMDLQVRPITDTHLGYSSVVWNWPTGDDKGNVQETFDKTFADFMAEGDRGLNPSAANGDLRVTPMLELRMSGANLPVPMVNAQTSYDLAENGITGTIKLTQSGANVSVNVVMQSAGTYTLTISDRACAATPSGGLSLAGVSGTTNGSINNRYLTDLADSSHTIYLTSSAAPKLSACQTMIDLPNGGQNGKMVDPGFYPPYAIAARDISTSTTNAMLLAYVPLNLTDDKGGAHMALTARVPFRPDNADAWGSATEARLVWLVQMLDASGSTNIVHSYFDEWTLAGWTVAEDRGLKVGVAYEDPLTDNDQNKHDRMWALTNSLERTFSAGRSDMTIAGVQSRFDRTVNGSVSEEQRWGLAQNAFRVQVYDFATQDGLASIPMTVTPQLLANFTGQNVKAPLLLYLQESTSRDMALGDAQQANNGVWNINFTGVVTSTVAGLSWSPFQYRDNQWQEFPIAQYWDQMKIDLKPAFAADVATGEDEDKVTLAQSYFASVRAGVFKTFSGRLPSISNPPALDKILREEWTSGEHAEAFGAIAEKMAVKLIERSATAEKYAKALVGDINPKSTQFKQLRTMANKVNGKLTQFESRFGQRWKHFSKGLSGAQGAAALALGIASQFDSPAAKKAVAGLTLATAVLDMIGSVKEAYDSLDAIRDFSTPALKQAFGSGKNGMKAFVKAQRAVKAGAVVGFAITATVATAMFITQIALSHIRFGGLEFNAKLAELVAELIVAGIMLALSLAIPVGSAIAAVIGAIDGLITFACAVVDLAKDPNQAKKKKWSESSPVGKRLCKGISGLMGAVIKTFIYNQRGLIGNMASPNRMQIYNLDAKLVDTDRDLGYTPGAKMQVSVGITNTILRSTFLKSDNKDSCAGFKTNANGDVITDTLGQSVCMSEWDYAKENDLIPLPVDPLALPYFWQYSDANARKANFSYRLQTTQQNIHGGLNLGPSDWSRWQQTGTRKFTMTDSATGVAALTATGINQPLQVVLSEGYAVPVQECFIVPFPVVFPVCTIRADRSTKQLPLGDGLLYDVFPTTIDQFFAAVSRAGGFAPAWAQSGDMTFDRQIDFDGDGLMNKADGGNDPDDSKWDSDGDGLPDNVELGWGSDPQNADTDGDTLNDAFELRRGISPTMADTDGDGLRDNAELAGWSIVVGSAGSWQAWVYADPSEPDADMDTLPDILEQIYGLNPNVPNNPNVLTFESQLTELGAPERLWRFEETASAQTFSDWSGYGQPATCAAASTCPQAGLEGAVTNGLHFDGSGYFSAALPDSFNGNHSFTVAFWMDYETQAERAWLMDFGNPGTLTAAHWLINPNGTTQFGFWAGAQNSVDLSSYQGSWTHVATVYDADAQTLKTYLNGTLANSVTGVSAPNIQASGGLRVGQNFNGEANFKGWLDELVLYPHALTSEEIQAVTAAHYNINDQVVRPRTDASELAYNATAKNELNNRVMQGLLKNELPAAISSVPARAFVLQPEESQTMSGKLDLANTIASGVYNVTQAAFATVTDWAKQSGGASLWLDFNETSAPFYDISGSYPQRNGTCTDCPTGGQPGKRGNSVSFNGTSNAVTVQNAPNFANQSFSVSFWAKLAEATASDNQWVVSGGEMSNNKALHIGFTSSGTFLCGFWADFAEQSWTRDTNWHQWGCTYNTDSKEQKLYRDGALIFTRTANANYQGTGPLTIGTFFSGIGFFKGQLDDLRLFPRALTAQEAGELGVQSLVMYRFGATGQIPGSDLSGNNNTATCNGTNCAAQGASFNGRNFQTTKNVDLTNGTFTIQLIAGGVGRNCPPNAYCAPFTSGPTPGQPYRQGLLSVSDLYLEHNGPTLQLSIGTSTTDRSKFANVGGLFAGQLVTLVYDKGTWRQYANRELKNSGTITTFPRNAPSAAGLLTIGTSASYSQSYIDSLAYFAIYPRVLSSDEISATVDNQSISVYLPLDELPGSTVFRNRPTISLNFPEPRDTAGFNNANCVGSACPLAGVEGRVGDAARFDGNDVLTVPVNVPELFYSASLWFRTTQPNSVMYAVTGEGANGPDRMFYLDATGKVCTNVSLITPTVKLDTFCTPDGKNYADNRWHSVESRYKRGDASSELYVDGVLIISGIKESQFDRDTAVVLGQGQRGLSNFIGDLDDVRVFSSSSSNDGEPNYFASAPEYLLHLNEPAGSTSFSNVGLDGNPVCVGACPTAGVKGPVGLAAQFTPSSTLSFSTAVRPMSVVFWAKRDGQGAEYPLTDDSTPGMQFRIGFDQSGHFLCGYSASSGWHGAITAESYQDSLWNQWACVLESTSATGAAAYDVSLYRNGSRVYFDRVSGFGGLISKLGQFNGALDEVAFYDRKLTALELNQMYMAQRSTVEERQPFAITVDRDSPTSTLRSTDLYRPDRDAVLSVSAVDQHSAVALVKTAIKNPGATGFGFSAAPQCMDAAVGVQWCPTFVPAGEGRYEIQTYAVDVAGNAETPSTTTAFYVDGTPPTITSASIIDDVLLAPDGTQLTFPFTFSDPALSGGYAGSGVQVTRTATLQLQDLTGAKAWGDLSFGSLGGNNWNLIFDMAAVPATGVYTVTVSVADDVGNQSVYTRRIRLNAALPVVSLDAAGLAPTATVSISSTGLLQGMIDVSGVPAGALAWLELNGSAVAKNYALTRPASQSSTAPGQPASMAVDGNSTTASATNSESNPWWQIDLAEAQRIDTVYLNVSTTITNVNVFLSDRPFTSTNPTAVQNAAYVWRASRASVGTTVTFNRSDFTRPGAAITTTLLARYMRVQLGVTGTLALKDVTVRNLPATCTFGTCPTFGQSGVRGTAAAFDGSSSYISMPRPVQDDFSIAFWIKTTQSGSGTAWWEGNGLVDAESPGFTNDFGVALGDGDILFGVGQPDGDTTISSGLMTVNDGNWHHVAAVREKTSGNLHLYVDGLLASSGVGSTNSLTATANLRIGSLQTGENFFAGTLDEVFVYDRLLTADEITQLARLKLSGVKGVDVAFAPLSGSAFYNEQPLTGTVLHLPLEDTPPQTGTLTFKDLSSNNLSATCTSCPGIGQRGPRGSAVSFDGVNQALSVASLPDSLSGDKSFTAAFWMKYQPTSKRSWLMYLGAAGIFWNSVHWLINTDDNAQFGFWGSAAQNSFSLKTYQDQWVHVATVYDAAGKTLTTYLNGVQQGVQASVTSAPNIQTSGGLHLGHDFTGAESYFKGNLDDVRLLNRALSAAEVQTLYLGSDPFVALDFEDGSLADTSSLANPVTPAGDPAAVPGQVGNGALRFDGINDTLSIASLPSSLSGDKSFTAAFWMKYQPTSARSWLMYLGNPGALTAAHWLINKNGNTYTAQFGFWGSDAQNSFSLTPYPDQWVHVATVYDAAGKTLKTYLNGVQQGSPANVTSAPNLQANGGLHIGESYFGTESYFKGDLDDVRLYPRALAAEEIKEITLKGWKPAVLAPGGVGASRSTWTYTLPSGLEGNYSIQVRGTNQGNQSRVLPAEWQGGLDTTGPRAALTPASGGGFALTANDFNLNEASLNCPGGTTNTRVNYQSLWYAALTTSPRPYGLTAATCGYGGSLADNSFDGDGKVTTHFGSNTFKQSAYAITVQSDNKLVVVGSILQSPYRIFALARYNENGALDPSFGAAGKVTTGFNSHTYPADVALQGNKILVSGSNLVLVRYNADGTPDPSFGTNGILTTSVASGSGVMVLRPDNKIVLAGYKSVPSYENNFVVVQYTADGVLDTSFGGTGVVLTDFGGDDRPDKIALQSDGKVVVVGSSKVNVIPSAQRIALARYNTNGTLDTSFGAAGKVTTNMPQLPSIAGILIQGDGKILLAGDNAGSNGVLIRYTAAGALDTSFSGTGIMLDNTVAHFTALIVQGDKVLVAGQDTSRNFVVARYYTTTANLDPTFGNGGRVSIDFGGSDIANGLTVQNDQSKFAVAGDNGVDFAVARYYLNSVAAPNTRLVCDSLNNCTASGPVALAALSAPASANDAASLYASVLSPVANDVLRSTDPITVAGFATAEPDTLQAITLTVDGTAVGSQVFASGTVSDTVFEIPWTPAGDGAYTLEATALDSTGALTTSAPTLVYVDTLPPQANFGATVITTTAYNNSLVDFSGPLTEANPASLQLQVGEMVINAQATGDTWHAAWPVDSTALPDGQTYPLTLTVTDVANNMITRTANALIDVLSPAPSTLAVTADGSPISIGGTLPAVSSTLAFTWTPGSDGGGLSGYVAGWDVSSGDTVNTHWQTYAPTDTLASVITLSEGQKATAVLNTTDLPGNLTAQTVGPFYAESPLTPDYISITPDPDTGAIYRGWAAQGCSLLGTDERIFAYADPHSTLASVQNLYTTWNADSLRLLWTGADWDIDGDLFVYLDTQTGGADRAYDPYPTRETIVLLPATGGLPIQGNAPSDQVSQPLTPLAQRWQTRHQLTGPSAATATTVRPFRADYVLWIKSQTEAVVLKWTDATQTWEAVTNPIGYGYRVEEGTQYTDLQVPFDTIGLTDPALTPLSLLAFASEDDLLRIWATAPRNNPANSSRLTEFTRPQSGRPFVLLNTYSWAKAGAGQCPNGALSGGAARASTSAPNASAPQYTDVIVDLNLSAEPAALTYSVLGDGLYDIMSQLSQFSGNADFTSAQSELCAVDPATPGCVRDNPPSAGTQAAQANYPLKSQVEPIMPGKGVRPMLLPNAPTTQPEFNAEDNLSAEFDTSFPPVGDGEAVTYTFRLKNQGTTTLTHITLDALTYGPLRLPDGVSFSDTYGEYYSLVQDIGDLAPGAETTVNVVGQIDYTFDAGNVSAGLADLDVVLYDSRGTAFANQLDWLYASYQLDLFGPLTVLEPASLLIQPGLTTITGRVYDESPVPDITLEVSDPIGDVTDVVCDRPDAAVPTWSCAWDASAAVDGDQYSVRAIATDAYGQTGDWTSWLDLTVDDVTPEAAFDAATRAALSDALIGPAETTFTGRVTDNRSGSAVDVCTVTANGEACQRLAAAADDLPQATFVYNDIPETPLPLGAGQACYSGNEVYRFIHVPDSFTIADVKVGLNIEHPYRYDATAWLQAPSGSWLALLWNAEPQTQNVDALLSDSAVIDFTTDRSDHDVSEPLFDRTLRPENPLGFFRSEQAQGDWLLMLCDYFPSEDDGTYQQAQLILTAETLPQNVAARWNYQYATPGSVDHAGPYTLRFYGVDSIGNRSTTPLETTFYADNVDPVITVTQVITTQVYTEITPVLLTGTVSDGSAITALFADVQSPSGALYNVPITVTGGAWSLAFDLYEVGDYIFHINAMDAAGNSTQSAAYFVTNTLPVVTNYAIYLPVVLRGSASALSSEPQTAPIEAPAPTAAPAEILPPPVKATPLATPVPAGTPDGDATGPATSDLLHDRWVGEAAYSSLA